MNSDEQMSRIGYCETMVEHGAIPQTHLPLGLNLDVEDLMLTWDAILHYKQQQVETNLSNQFMSYEDKQETSPSNNNLSSAINSSVYRVSGTVVPEKPVNPPIPPIAYKFISHKQRNPNKKFLDKIDASKDQRSWKLYKCYW